MGYESIAHETEGYWLRGYEGKRNNCFSKIQLFGQKNFETKHLLQVKAWHQSFFRVFKVMKSQSWVESVWFVSRQGCGAFCQGKYLGARLF